MAVHLGTKAVIQPFRNRNVSCEGSLVCYEELLKKFREGWFLRLYRRGVETILKVEWHDSYKVKNGGPKNFLQTTPFKVRENDTTPSYYA